MRPYPAGVALSQNKRKQSTGPLCQLRGPAWTGTLGHVSISLEQQFQAELGLPRDIAEPAASHERCNLPCRPDRRGHIVCCRRSSAENGRDRVAEIGVIEQVEKVGAELNTHPLPDPRLLHHTDVGFHEAWPHEGIPSEVAERAICGRREAGRVEPLVNVLIGVHVAARYNIGPRRVEVVVQIWLGAFSQREEKGTPV
jgi:hypothetical protein